MTQDFVEDAIEACNRERVPFVFAMRSGDDGEWIVNYNLEHHSSATGNKEQEVCNLITLSLANKRKP
tara:strand:- start:28404 stop:28604 length:201 start_codon:yes stop_codon:yes gene_type:complete